MKQIIPDESFWLQVLGRPSLVFDTDASKAFIQNETVLITGAGGTIGTELCRACLAMDAREVVAVDQNEYALWRLQSGFASDKRLRVELGSVTDQAFLDSRVMPREPAVLFHAAAVKHVGFAERQPVAAVRVNVGGALAMLACDGSAPGMIRKAVLVSTDKAAAPSTVMGQSKRIAEGAWRGWGDRGVAVRPVNVVGSSGSVGERFLGLLRDGMLVAASSASRMFMTAQETAAMILAGVGWGGRIVLPSPAPDEITMRDLAGRIAAAMGLGSVDIGTAPLMPGEKASEVLTDDADGMVAYLGNGLGAVANLGDPDLAVRIASAAEGGNDRIVRQMLTRAFAGRMAA